MRFLLFLIFLPLLGCGTFAANSDTPSGLYAGLDERPKFDDNPNVRIVETGPDLDSGGVWVIGTSCMNKLWSPPPDRDNTIALMKRQAVEKA